MKNENNITLEFLLSAASKPNLQVTPHSAAFAEIYKMCALFTVPKANNNHKSIFMHVYNMFFSKAFFDGLS